MDTLIVGAGPVGLSLALALIRRGQQVAVVDQRPGIPQDPRATTLQPPVLHAMSQWGVLDELRARGVVVDRLQYWDWSSRRCLADLDYEALAGATTCPYRLHIDQAAICAVLLEAIESAAPGTVRWRQKATSVEASGGGVRLVTSARGGHVAIHEGRWLCGADGLHSTVRAQVDIPFEGPDHEEAFVTARLEPEAMQQLSERAKARLANVSYLYLPDGWAMVMALRDHVRVLFKVDGATEDLGPKATKERAYALLGAGEHHLRTMGLYRVKLRLAQRFREGRVVLLGDAAHVGYPVGGSAMNAGILDAHALADALAADDGAAVDRICAERRLWVRRHLLGQTSRELKAMEANWPWTRAYRSMDTARFQAREHLLQLSLLS